MRHYLLDLPVHLRESKTFKTGIMESVMEIVPIVPYIMDVVMAVGIMVMITLMDVNLAETKVEDLYERFLLCKI